MSCYIQDEDDSSTLLIPSGGGTAIHHDEDRIWDGMLYDPHDF